MTDLDRLYAAMQTGGDGDGMAFYRALADAELFLLLTAEPEGAVLVPRVFELAEGSVLLAFDNEERLAGFAEGAVAYAALPGRVIALQMAGQGLSLGLNLGSGAASEVILPPEALAWLMQMLDQHAPVALVAQVAGFEPPNVPQMVRDALPLALGGAASARLVGVRYRDGRRGQMLALTGVDAAAEAKIARAVTEALAFSGLEAGVVDLVFLAEGQDALSAMEGVALVLKTPAVVTPEPQARAAPGRDPSRPPILR